MLRSGLRLLPLAALAALSCTNASGTSGPTTPTLIAVSPVDFAGDVPCTDAPGAMRSFVVTIYDLGSFDDPQTPFALPSSVLRTSGDVFRPTPCETTAAFGFVIPGHRYDAEVDVYDRTDLVAIGPGGRQLVDDKTGSYVPPRWTTTCGRKENPAPGEGAVTAAYYITRFIRGCEPLQTTAPETPTGIRVDLAAALGELECGEGTGQVSFYAVERAGSANVPSVAACDTPVEETGLEPGTTYTFAVQAFESGATTPRWATTCQRKALKGAIVPATCDPLSEITP